MKKPAAAVKRGGGGKKKGGGGGGWWWASVTTRHFQTILFLSSQIHKYIKQPAPQPQPAFVLLHPADDASPIFEDQ